MTREEAIKILNAIKMLMCRPDGTPISDGYEALDMAIEALLADAEPKGVLQGYCKGANIIQTIRHEELTQIANTRKAVEYIVQYERQEADNPKDKCDLCRHAIVGTVVRCKDCRHANECHKSVQYTHNEPRTVTIGYSPIEWCSRGERK